MDVDAGAIVVILYIVGGVVTCVIFATDWYLDKCSDQLDKQGITSWGTNDDDRAVDIFKGILQGTTRKLLVYDDGNVNDNGKSVYGERQLIEAVASRMEVEKDLRVYCLFNCATSDLAFVTTLRRDFPTRFRVKIRRSQDRPDDDQHFKIGDFGRIGCLSEHEYNDDDRDYIMFDLRNQSLGVRWRVFGVHQCVFWMRWFLLAKTLRRLERTNVSFAAFLPWLNRPHKQEILK